MYSALLNLLLFNPLSNQSLFLYMCAKPILLDDYRPCPLKFIKVDKKSVWVKTQWNFCLKRTPWWSSLLLNTLSKHRSVYTAVTWCGLDLLHNFFYVMSLNKHTAHMQDWTALLNFLHFVCAKEVLVICQVHETLKGTNTKGFKSFGACMPKNHCRYVELKNKGTLYLKWSSCSPATDCGHRLRSNTRSWSLSFCQCFKVAATYSHTVIHTLVHKYLKPNWHRK